MSIFKTLLTIAFIQALMGNGKQLVEALVKITVGITILFAGFLIWLGYGPIGILIYSLLIYGLVRIWKSTKQSSDQQNNNDQPTTMQPDTDQHRPMFEKR